MKARRSSRRPRKITEITRRSEAARGRMGGRGVQPASPARPMVEAPTLLGEGVVKTPLGLKPSFYLPLEKLNFQVLAIHN